MELQGSMCDGVIEIASTLIIIVGGDDVIGLVMAHGPVAQHNEAAEHGSDQDQSDDQVINCEARPKGENRPIQPGIYFRV